MNKWVESNWMLRLSSIVIAVILWLIVTQSFPFQQNDQTTIQIDDVKVGTRYDPNQYALADISDERVRLTLTGDKKNLSSIPSYQVYVDLTNVKAGKEENVPIQVSGLPKNVKISITPADTSVRLEEKVHREMPIQVEYREKLLKGYAIDQAMIDPERVLVKGTEAQLAKIKYVRAVVNLEKEQFPLKKWVTLQVVSSERVLKEVKVSPETARISIKLRIPSKNLPLTYQVIKQPPVGVVIDQIVLEPALVTISGANEDLQAIIKYPPIPLDLSKITENQTMTMPIPAINQAIDPEPKKTTVKIYIKKD